MCFTPSARGNLRRSASSRALIAAFTLVELLVVIGIIALLIALLLPALARARRQAELVMCTSNMHQLAIAWSSYVIDNKGWMPSAYTRNGRDWIDGAAQDAGDPELDPKDLALSPGERAVKYGALWRYTKSLKVFRCPADPSDYGWSFSVSGALNGEMSNPLLKVTQVRHSTQQLLLIEEHDPRGQNENSFLTNGTVPVSLAYSFPNLTDWPATFHGRSYDVCFVDGHAETWRFDDPASQRLGAVGSPIPESNLDMIRLGVANTMR